MEEGWICLHRKILKWEWYQDTNTFRVFIHLLLNANWEDTKYMGMLLADELSNIILDGTAVGRSIKKCLNRLTK